MLMNFAILLQDEEILSSLFYRHDSTPERLDTCICLSRTFEAEQVMAHLKTLCYAER